MAYPTSLDSFPSATTLAANNLNTDPHSTLHGNLGNAVAALEAKLGADSSAVTTTVDYKIGHLGGDLTGTVTAATIAAGAVTLAKHANLAANAFIGNNTASPATPMALTTAQAKALLAITTADVSGTVAIANGGTAATTAINARANLSASQLLVPTAVKSTTYVAASGDYVGCDTTSAGFTVTLPTAPADGTTIAVALVKQSSTNAVTVAAGGSDVFDVAAGTTTATIALLFQTETFQYKASSAIWYRTSSRFPKTQLYASFSGDATVNSSGVVTLGTVTVGKGGTGQTTQQAALDALAGAVTNHAVLAGDGTHVTARSLAAADIPGTLGATTFTGNISTTSASITADTLSTFTAGLEARTGPLGLTIIATEYNGAGATFDARSTRGNGNGNFSHSLSNDVLFLFRGGGSTDTAFADCGKIQWKATQDFGAGAFGNKCEIYTVPNGSTTVTLAATFGQDQSLTVAGPFASTGAASLSSTLALVAGATLQSGNQSNTASRTELTATSTQTFNTTASMVHTWAIYAGTDTWTVAPSATNMFLGYVNAGTFQNSGTVNLKPIYSFKSAFTKTTDTATGRNNGTDIDFWSISSYSAVNAGTFTAGNGHIGFKSDGILNATGSTLASHVGHSSDYTVTNGTITTLTHYQANDVANSGTVTTQVGVDIAALSNGTTNIGFRCAGSMVYTPTVCTCTSNAATVPVTVSHGKVTNTSAATCTITLATTNAVDGQETLVRFFDATAASQTVTFTNAETGKAGAAPASLGSTSIPSTYRFIFNSGTSKWTYTGN